VAREFPTFAPPAFRNAAGRRSNFKPDRDLPRCDFWRKSNHRSKVQKSSIQELPKRISFEHSRILRPKAVGLLPQISQLLKTIGTCVQKYTSIAAARVGVLKHFWN